MFDPGTLLEANEEFYIKQNTKVIINVGGEPGAWMAPVGLPTEIVPLSKPYDRWTGNVFQGRVLCNGKVVPSAEIEIEYMNHKPLLDKIPLQRRPMQQRLRMPSCSRPFLLTVTAFSLSAFPKRAGGALRLSIWTPPTSTRGRNVPGTRSFGSQAVDMKEERDL